MLFFFYFFFFLSKLWQCGRKTAYFGRNRERNFAEVQISRKTKNRRGLGFRNKPLLNNAELPLAEAKSFLWQALKFGHSGFYELFIWADPERKLTFNISLLINRVYRLEITRNVQFGYSRKPYKMFFFRARAKGVIVIILAKCPNS